MQLHPERSSKKDFINIQIKIIEELILFLFY